MVRGHILWYSAEQSTAKENENAFYGKRTHSMCVTRSQRNAERASLAMKNHIENATVNAAKHFEK